MSISAKKYDAAAFLLEEGSRTVEEISGLAGISTATVCAIADGSRSPPGAKLAKPAHQSADPFSSEKGRCIKCGKIVQIPCLGCRSRKKEEIRWGIVILARKWHESLAVNGGEIPASKAYSNSRRDHMRYLEAVVECQVKFILEYDSEINSLDMESDVNQKVMVNRLWEWVTGLNLDLQDFIDWLKSDEFRDWYVVSAATTKVLMGVEYPKISRYPTTKEEKRLLKIVDDSVGQTQLAGGMNWQPARLVTVFLARMILRSAKVPL